VKDLLDKLSSYNIFNYLLPGVIFAAMGQHIGNIPLLHSDMIVSAFLCYFYGLIISRIGSLAIEPSLKWLRVVKYAPYNEYVTASQIDPKLEILSEQNNSYRTLIALVLVLLMAGGIDALRRYFGHTWYPYAYVAILLLGILFILAYRKQSEYITKRIGVHIARLDEVKAADSEEDANGTNNS
jgi:hypothetical protein